MITHSARLNCRGGISAIQLGFRAQYSKLRRGVRPNTTSAIETAQSTALAKGRAVAACGTEIIEPYNLAWSVRAIRAPQIQTILKI
jgi:hypothetical protein